MMHDDPLAMRIAAIPLPPELDAVEAGVFAAIDEQAHARVAGRTLGVWSVGAALAIGLVGGGLAGSGSPAEASTPIGIDGALAPSTLLLGR